MTINSTLKLTGILILVFACNTNKPIEQLQNLPQPSIIGNFEGKIIYSLIFRDKTGEMTPQEAEEFMGTQQVFTIKGNKYKSEMNGMMNMTQYYLGQDTIFNQFNGVNSLLWIDATSNEDELIDYEITENATVIAGIKCDLLSIKTKEGKMEYYYNKNYAVDPQLYANHKFGFWKFCLEKTRSLPIKSTDDSKEVYMEIVAKDIQRMKVDDAAFIMPNLPKVKNPEEE
jgi:hypothetical protein